MGTLIKFKIIGNFLNRKLIVTNSIKNLCSRTLSTDELNGKKIRIGCASGFWGDTATAVPQLVAGGNLDFLVFDYLSEITMSLLVASRKKDPNLGYAPDFVAVAMAPFLPEIQRQGIRVVSNAGGINPHSCALALRSAASNAGVDNLRIAVVTGDDLMPFKSELEREKVTDMNTGSQLPQTLTSMNAYLGAGPIAQALDMGADVVITGRCVDSALVLGPLLHTFKWDPQEFDKLAAGSLAGHLLECGAQTTGGINTDWESIPHWDNMGFPIAECDEAGRFLVTKPPNTGGRVNFGSVAEQLVYEIDDPQCYQLPDVICDFSSVNLKEVGEDEVLVTGAKGRPPSPFYKVSATYADGYRATALCPVIGPKAALKAKMTGDAVLNRCRRIFAHFGMEDFKRVHMEILGSEANYGHLANPQVKDKVREAVLWSAVHHESKMAVRIFAQELAHSATGAAPGLTTLVGGRPKPTPVLRLFSFLYPKNHFKVQVQVGEDQPMVYTPPVIPQPASRDSKPLPAAVSPIPPPGSHSYRLEELAFTRSGDKADNANIGVIARHPNLYPYLQQALTVPAVARYFAHLYQDCGLDPAQNISRFELRGIHGLNFVLKNSLGGGGIASLRSDPQGKALGQMMLDFEVHNMPSLESLTSGNNVSR